MTVSDIFRRATRPATIIGSLTLCATALISGQHLFAAPPVGAQVAGVGTNIPTDITAPGKTTVPTITLRGNIPFSALTDAIPVGRVPANQPIQLALTLPLRDQAELANHIQGLYDTNDPRYGQYLTPMQFTAMYAPTQAQYDQVVAFAKAQGFTVTNTHPNRVILDVTAPAGKIEAAFGVNLLQYRSRSTGKTFFSADREPSVPATLWTLSGVIGLTNAAVPYPKYRLHNQSLGNSSYHGLRPAYGAGVYGSFTPNDIIVAYQLQGIAGTGGGIGETKRPAPIGVVAKQTLALFEQDGYTASDIAVYENAYNLRTPPLQNILVDGASGRPSGTGGEVEVELDIEMMVALYSTANKILVYEGPSTVASYVDIYNKIATDNLAQSVSTSWGLTLEVPSISTAEDTAFQQMAAQGQSMFSAAGDRGAYPFGLSAGPLVEDPASPNLCVVGGTTLFTSAPGGSYVSETTWNNGFFDAGAGGISLIWKIPSYQVGLVSAATLGSNTYRNIPDVSLNSDPQTGYSIYVTSQGGWTSVGGTSAAAPLWAAYIAKVNERRAILGKGVVGFPNPAIYAIGKSSTYNNNFHDIRDGSTNLYYPAVPGYDLATGWGSFKGATLYTTLAARK